MIATIENDRQKQNAATKASLNRIFDEAYHRQRQLGYLAEEDVHELVGDFAINSMQKLSAICSAIQVGDYKPNVEYEEGHPTGVPVMFAELTLELACLCRRLGIDLAGAVFSVLREMRLVGDQIEEVLARASAGEAAPAVDAAPAAESNEELSEELADEALEDSSGEGVLDGADEDQDSDEALAGGEGGEGGEAGAVIDDESDGTGA